MINFALFFSSHDINFKIKLKFLLIQIVFKKVETPPSSAPRGITVSCYPVITPIDIKVY